MQSAQAETDHHDKGCICRGNWRSIVAESEPFLDKRFKDSQGDIYVFYGVVHAREDYYYGLFPVGEGGPRLLSCVGSLETHGYTLVSPLN